MKLIIITWITLQIFSSYALSCSSFSIEDKNKNVWVGKSFDFGNPNGHMLLNKRNVFKKSLTIDWSIGKSWISKYASITFNQAGRDFPFGGMNEEGLNMEILWLSSTEYPEVVNGETINESQLIQLVLDTAKSTSEAINIVKESNIVPIMATVHYMICDANNECSVIEYLNGRLKVTKQKTGVERIIQNDEYSIELNAIRNDYGTQRESTYNLNRIFNNATSLDTQNKSMKHVLKSLDIVKQGSWTKWQIVYNLSNKKAWFKTTSHPKLKYVQFKDYDLNCNGHDDTIIVDMNTDQQGNIKNHVMKFTNDKNKEMIHSFQNVPDILKIVANTYSKTNHICLNQGIYKYIR